jgi:FtsH-binding integral membrane protein
VRVEYDRLGSVVLGGLALAVYPALGFALLVTASRVGVATSVDGPLPLFVCIFLIPLVLTALTAIGVHRSPRTVLFLVAGTLIGGLVVLVTALTYAAANGSLS